MKTIAEIDAAHIPFKPTKIIAASSGLTFKLYGEISDERLELEQRILKHRDEQLK